LKTRRPDSIHFQLFRIAIWFVLGVSAIAGMFYLYPVLFSFTDSAKEAPAPPGRSPAPMVTPTAPSPPDLPSEKQKSQGFNPYYPKPALPVDSRAK